MHARTVLFATMQTRLVILQSKDLEAAMILALPA